MRLRVEGRAGHSKAASNIFGAALSVRSILAPEALRCVYDSYFAVQMAASGVNFNLATLSLPEFCKKDQSAPICQARIYVGRHIQE